MPKLATALKILRAIVSNPGSLARVIDRENGFENHVVSAYGLGSGLPTIDLLDLLPGLEETIEPYSFLEGGSFPTDIALLKGLVRRYELADYLEIGTWRGESVANVASVASRCVTVRFSDQEMRERGLAHLIPIHDFFSKNLRNVKHIHHASESFDFTSLGEKYDLIYIDGNYDYDPIKIDTRNAFTLLRDNRSVIVWHGYGWGTEKARWSSLAGILDGCPADKRNSLYHVSNTKCAIYIQGQFQASFICYPETPNKSFRVRLSMRPIGPRPSLSSNGDPSQTVFSAGDANIPKQAL